jgi:predicted HicB family RNase H-like nuclease
MKKQKLKKVSVWLPEDLHKKAKLAAYKNYQSFARWLTQTIENRLKEEKK